MYLSFSVAALAILFFPAPGVLELLGPNGLYVWNGSMLVGGVMSLFGASIARKYMIELVGLPLLISSLMVYGITILALIDVSGPREDAVLVFLGCVIIGCALGLVGRTWEIWKVSTVISRMNHHGIAD